MEVGWEQIELLLLSQSLSREIFREVFIGLVKSRTNTLQLQILNFRPTKKAPADHRLERFC